MSRDTSGSSSPGPSRVYELPPPPGTVNNPQDAPMEELDWMRNVFTRGIKRSASSKDDGGAGDGSSGSRCSKKTQLDFAEIEKAILINAQGWVNLPPSEKIRILDREGVWRVLNIDQAVLQELRKSIVDQKNSGLACERLTENLLLEIFFRDLKGAVEEDILTKDFRTLTKRGVDFAPISLENYNTMKRTGIVTYESMFEIVRISTIFLTHARQRIERFPHLTETQRYNAEPEDEEIYYPPNFTVYRERMQRRMKDLRREFYQLCGDPEVTKAATKAGTEATLLDEFARRLASMTKFRTVKVLYEMEIMDKAMMPRYSTVGFNSDSSFCASLCGKTIKILDWDRVMNLHAQCRNISVHLREDGVFHQGSSFAWHPSDKTKLCVGMLENKSYMGTLCMIDINEGFLSSSSYENPGEVFSIDWDSDGSKVVSIWSRTRDVSFWSPDSNECLGSVNIIDAGIPICAKFNKFKKDVLAIGYDDGSFSLHDNRNLRRPFQWIKPSPPKAPVTAFDFISADQLILTTQERETYLLDLNIRDLSVKKKLTTYTNPRSSDFIPAAVAAHGDYFAVMGNDNSVVIYNKYAAGAIATHACVISKGYPPLPLAHAQVMGSVAWAKTPDSHSLLANFQGVLVGLQLDF